MIRVVLFDFGGVLTEGGGAGSIKGTFAQAYGIAASAVELTEAVQDAFRGTITDEAFLESINNANPSCTPATIRILMENADYFKRSAAVYGLAEKLRSHGLQTGIFSNVFAVSVAVLQRDGFYDGFVPLFLSCNDHMMKPETEYYAYVVKQLGVRPAEILFIDDKDDFLAPARKVGMHTIRADSPAQIVADTKALIEKENGIRL